MHVKQLKTKEEKNTKNSTQSNNYITTQENNSVSPKLQEKLPSIKYIDRF